MQLYLNDADSPGKWYKLSSVDLFGEMHELDLSTKFPSGKRWQIGKHKCFYNLIYDHGCTLLAAMVMELWMFNFFFPHCQDDFTPERQPRRCWFNPVKSDYGGVPDDQQAMVRYLLDDLVTSPWRFHDGFEKRSDSMLGTCAKRFKPGFQNEKMIGTGPIYSYNLFSDINIRCQLDPSLFFLWRYPISLVPWWGEHMLI